MLGFLKRKQEQLALTVVGLCRDGFCAVVGESHYQDALRATTEVCVDTFEGRPAFTAVLVGESENAYDSNAIAVYSRRGKLGYLSRDNALAYRGVLEEVARRGYHGGACGAHLTGGEGGKSYGVVLRLADAESCRDELAV